MNTADTATARLRRKIAVLRENIALREMDRADVTIAMLERPDDAELQAQLAKAVKDIDEWRAALEGAEGALVVAENRDIEAERRADEAARQQAAAEARSLMADSVKLAAAVDKAIGAFVGALTRLNENHRQIAGFTYDAGVRGENRHHLISNLLSVRHAGAVLAARLIIAGFHDRLDYLTISRPASALDTTLADIVNGTTEKVEAQLSRALEG